MKFGKLTDINSVDFSLPIDPQWNSKVLNQEKNEILIYVGCTGWGMKEWVGKVYPKGARAASFLEHYGKQFNTIELNTTHYRIPDMVTVTKWRESVPRDFRFCPKLPQSISHSPRFGFGTGRLQQFSESIRNLDRKLGCCFMQLPPYFGSDSLSILEKFLHGFPKDLPLAIEFRHESWFRNQEIIKTFLQLLNHFNVSTVLTDVAGRRDVLHMGLSTNKVLIRFVGNNLHPTDFKRIDDWVQRLKKWIARGLGEIYIFTHEPDNLLAPELADYVVKQMAAIGKVQIRGPKLEKNQDGEQMSLF